MEQKLILVKDHNYNETLKYYLENGWRISQISAPGTACLTAECWILLEKTL